MARTPTFVPSVAALPALSASRTHSAARPHPAADAFVKGRRRARALMYGAGGAFRGLASRRTQLELQLVRMSGGRFGGFGPGGPAGPGGSGRPGDSHDDGSVDPSWGVSPAVHVVMRGRADESYRLAVANLIAMGTSLTAPAFVDHNVPLVIILSWMGAQQRHLSKYKNFYEEKGYEVHCVCNDLRTAIFPPASKAQARKIGDVIAQQPADRPVFVHAFSIGTGIYGLLLDGLRHEKEKLDLIAKKVTGVVFDSGPAPIFPRDVAKGLHTVCPIISKAVWEPIAQTFFWMTKARHSFERSEDALRKLQFPSPQLYFYSGDDKVIPHIKTAVEEFMDKNKQMGFEVYNKFWEKSVHASHLKVHPEEYMANLSSFINRCMELRSLNKAEGVDQNGTQRVAAIGSQS